MEIFAVKLNELLDKHSYLQLLSVLPNEKQNKIKKFVRFEDAQRSLIGEVLIRYIVNNKLGINNNDIVITKGQYGKPYLKEINGFHFNISHSGCWVLCAIDNYPIGIDIENIQSIDLNLAEQFFAKEEYNDLLEKPASQRISYFYELWTLKESYIKANGKGLYLDLNSFSFKIHNNTIYFKNKSEKENFYFFQYNIDTDYKMAICAKQDSFTNQVIEFSLNSLKELVFKTIV